jgi:hypothetical protein
MAEEAETRPPAARLISQAQAARAQSAAVRSQSAAARWQSQALRSQWVAAMSRSHALMSRSAAVMSRSQVLRSRPFRGQALAVRRGQASGPAFVSPATVRAQMTLTYRELVAAARRQAIGRARELGLLNG